MEPSKKARREMQADYNDVESLSYLLNSLKLEVEMLSESGKTTINHLPKICKGQEEHTSAGFREINEDDANDLSESSEEDEDDINQKHNETMFNLAVTQYESLLKENPSNTKILSRMCSLFEERIDELKNN